MQCEASECLLRWQYLLAVRSTLTERADVSPTSDLLSHTSAHDAASTHAAPATSLKALDVDCLRKVATALLIMDRPGAVSLDRRSRNVLHLSSTCSDLRALLLEVLVTMRQEHDERQHELASVCTRLGTSLKAMRAARKRFCAPGESVCASCGAPCPNHHGVFVRTSVASSLYDQTLSRAEDGSNSEPLRSGEGYCAHCWRLGFDLSTRPTAEGIEQTWEAPIEDGSWRLVQDFAGCELDAPLLAREEYSDAWDFASELASELATSGYALVGAAHHDYMATPPEDGSPALRSDWANRLSPEEQRALVAWDGRCSLLLADLVGSGYGDHLLSLELGGCGLDDRGLSLLSEALVGNALYVRYLSLSFNPIGDDGVIAFASALGRRRGLALMLPLLRWLHLGLGHALGDQGACALAAALREGVLPSLEILWCFGGFSEPAEPAQEEAPLLTGLEALQSACEVCRVVYEGIEGPAFWAM